MTTKIPVELSSTPGIVDGSNATAITIDSSENVTITGDLGVTGGQINTGNTAGDHSEFGTDGSGHTFIDASTSGGNMFFQQGGATKVTISSGNVGIGTTSPSQKLEVYNSATDSQSYVKIQNNRARNAAVNFVTTAANWYVGAGIGTDTDVFQIYDGDVGERMRITSGGNVGIGTTSTGGNAALVLNTGSFSLGIKHFANNGQTSNSFEVGGSVVGSITHTTSATAFNTSSDARLKDVTGEARGLEVINALNPVAYNWKADGNADEGLIAQEVLDIVPNAVSQTEDEYYQMDYSKLVTPLIKAVQEQQTIIEDLKTRIETLEG